MENDLPLLLVKKGLDSEQVDFAFTEASNLVKQLESDQSEFDKRIATLNREIAEVKSALKRSSPKPSFSDLGAAFEQTLRVAEEQAAKLIADAQTASTNTRLSAESDASALTEAAQLQADKVLADADNLVQRLIKESDKKFASTLKIARTALENAQAQVVAAESAAADIAREGLLNRNKIESDLVNEKDLARGEIATLRQIHERDHRRISDEIAAARAKAERESNRLSAENEKYIAQLLEDSQQQLDLAGERARSSVVEEQNNFGRARQEGVALIRDARETAAGIIRRARAREQTLTERLEERTSLLLQHGEKLVEEFSLEREKVEAFNSELRIISMSERGSDSADNSVDFTSELTDIEDEFLDQPELSQIPDSDFSEAVARSERSLE